MPDPSLMKKFVKPRSRASDKPVSFQNYLSKQNLKRVTPERFVVQEFKFQKDRSLPTQS